MVRKILVLGLLAISLAAPSTHAQTSPAGAAAPAVSAVDPASIQALKDMGVFLQSLKRFRVETEVTGERVLADGQKLQHTATAKMEVQRPNKIRVLMQSARSEREIVYDGKTVTLFTPAQKYYSTVEFTGTIGELIDKLEEGYGVELPLSDLFLFGTPAAPLDNIESAMNAGQDFIDDDLCDHYAFRQGKIDWQIWITTGSKPLPRKVVITNRADEARPQSVSPDRLEPEADVQGFGVQVHAAQGRDQDRNRAAENQVRSAIMKRSFGKSLRPRSPSSFWPASPWPRWLRRAVAVVAVAVDGGGACGGGRGGEAVAAAIRTCRPITTRPMCVPTTFAAPASTTSTSTGTNVNVNRNTNVNVNVDRGGCCNGGWDNDYHPVATAVAVTAAVGVTSAIVGSMVRTVPTGCVPVNYGGMIYQQCGGTWYQPQGSQFVVINPPY